MVSWPWWVAPQWAAPQWAVASWPQGVGYDKLAVLTCPRPLLFSSILFKDLFKYIYSNFQVYHAYFCHSGAWLVVHTNISQLGITRCWHSRLLSGIWIIKITATHSFANQASWKVLLQCCLCIKDDCDLLKVLCITHCLCLGTSNFTRVLTPVSFTHTPLNVLFKL